MRVQVEIPDPILVQGSDSIVLCVGDSMDTVVVHGDGTIVVKGNGGGASSFTVDTKKVLRDLRRAIVKPQRVSGLQAGGWLS